MAFERIFSYLSNRNSSFFGSDKRFRDFRDSDKWELTRLASGSRHVCEFLESETAFGETINGVRCIWRETITVLETTLSPERADAENDKLRGARDLQLEEVEEALADVVEGNLEAPIAAMLAIVICNSYSDE